MTKLPRFRTRKPPKRKAPERPKLDDDLIDLALALDAQRLDNNAEGWFSVPWRNGWNAVQLALVVAAAKEVDCPTQAGCMMILNKLSRWVDRRTVDSDAYVEADEILEGSLHDMTRAGFRCFQLLVARSDAGGEAYNAILRRAFERLLPEHVAFDVLNWRRKDALGDRASSARIEAFNLAWKRGLYRAAYAV